MPDPGGTAGIFLLQILIYAIHIFDQTRHGYRYPSFGDGQHLLVRRGKNTGARVIGRLSQLSSFLYHEAVAGKKAALMAADGNHIIYFKKY